MCHACARAYHERVQALIDRLVGRVARAYTDHRLPSPTLALLGEARMQAASTVLARHREEARALTQRMDEGDAAAAAAFGALAGRALTEMRRLALERARTLGAPEAIAAAVHARFGDTDEPEYLDDPALDRELRVRLLAKLDELNMVLGSYRAFFRAMRGCLAPEGTTRILDLAAGHGGFALEATRIARAEGIDVEFTATDLKEEYLALGEEVAVRERLPVRFAVQDALDLSNIERGPYDVVTCTQSLHHFDPGMVARIFHEAARVAGRGVVLIDGCRSVSHGLLVPALSMLRYGDRAFAHDAWVSFRRFYAPEELLVLTGLALDDDALECKWMRPAHCLVRWRRPAP